MAMKAVVYTTPATRQLRKLAPKVRERLIGKLHRYAQTGSGDVVALVGQPGARLRVGDYRVVFVESESTISVRAVGHRRDIYE